jgi:hypothetical protein
MEHRWNDTVRVKRKYSNKTVITSTTNPTLSGPRQKRRLRGESPADREKSVLRKFGHSLNVFHCSVDYTTDQPLRICESQY